MRALRHTHTPPPHKLGAGQETAGNDTSGRADGRDRWASDGASNGGLSIR